MRTIIEQVRNSNRAKSYILLTLCFILAVMVSMRSGEEISDTKEDYPILRSAKLSKSADEMPNDTMTGGLGAIRERDSDIEQIVEKMRPVLEEKSGKKFESLEPVNYKTQLVAGRNFFVKAKGKLVDGGEMFVHLRVWQNIRRELELTAFQLDKQEHDHIDYFQ